MQLGKGGQTNSDVRISSWFVNPVQ